MVFDIEGKVALITGGASGIGLCYAKELLRNGAKGITIADMNPEFGDKALKEIKEEFGPNKAIFVPTDVTICKQFESAFQKTIETFKYVDILINNAGILDNSNWEKNIDVNFNGTVRGIILGKDTYLPKYKQGQEAIILNTSSIAGTQGFSSSPVYTATKYAIIGLTKSYGLPKVYESTKTRVIAICPGITLTALSKPSIEKITNGEKKILENDIIPYILQEPEHVAREAMRLMKYAPNGTAWVVEDNEPAYEYAVPHRSTMKANVLG